MRFKKKNLFTFYARIQTKKKLKTHIFNTHGGHSGRKPLITEYENHKGLQHQGVQ